MKRIMIIDDSMFDAIKNVASNSPDKEICGIIKGKTFDDVVICNEMIQIPNVADIDKAQFDYLMSPQGTIDALKDTSFVDKKSKKDFVAIWHTHPRGSSRPSAIDLMRAEYDVAYIIYGMGTDTIQSWGLKKLQNDKLFSENKIINKTKLIKHLK